MTDDVDIAIAVVGQPGVGKSYFIKAASGGEVDNVNDSLEAGPSAIQYTPVKFKGKHVILVDTPGCDILSCIDQIREHPKTQLVGMIYIQRITDNRIEQECQKDFKSISESLGDATGEQILLTTTMWGEIEPNEGERREEEMKFNCWRGLIKHEARVARFHGDVESAHHLLDLLLQGHKKRPLFPDSRNGVRKGSQTKEERVEARKLLQCLARMARLQGDTELGQDLDKQANPRRGWGIGPLLGAFKSRGRESSVSM